MTLRLLAALTLAMTLGFAAALFNSDFPSVFAAHTRAADAALASDR